ncbi:MAG TPA: hypothetical protein ENJ11_09050, partial [Gammaproteobacteria bacterium]|nr:hypothetical protein [Gammaproteobacteria bacterium]
MPAQNVLADASLTTASSFTSADAARANTYMDAAGTWNGAAEVTNTTGDLFTFSVANAVAPATTAYDVSVSVDVASGFRLPTAAFTVNVTESPGCPAMGPLSATQPGGVGSTIQLNIPANTDILPGCSYIFDLGLTTNDALPSTAAGFYPVDFNITWNNIDNDSS